MYLKSENIKKKYENKQRKFENHKLTISEAPLGYLSPPPLKVFFKGYTNVLNRR